MKSNKLFHSVTAFCGGAVITGSTVYALYQHNIGQWLSEECKIPAKHQSAWKKMPYGLPSIDGIREHGNIVLAYDTSRKNPSWVYERLTYENHMQKDAKHNEASRRNAQFFEDDSFPLPFRATLSSFYESGFDRGHQAAAANHRESQSAMNATFVLSNVCPQVGIGFNRHYWARFEKFVRDLRKTNKEVHVFTGPLYLPAIKPKTMAMTEKSTNQSDPGHPIFDCRERTVVKATSKLKRTLNDNHVLPKTSNKWTVSHEAIGEAPKLVAVPTHFYKLILVERDIFDDDSIVPKNQFGVAAFVLPNASIPASTPLDKFLVPWDDLESVLGKRMFPRLIGDEPTAALVRHAVDDRISTIRSNIKPSLPDTTVVANNVDGLDQTKFHKKQIRANIAVTTQGPVSKAVSPFQLVPVRAREMSIDWYHLCDLTNCTLPAENWFVRRSTTAAPPNLQNP